MAIKKLLPSEHPALPFRPAPPQGDAAISLHPVPSSGVLVKVEPPRTAGDELVGRKHVPCDIVLAIDVSGSMSTEAPVPGDTAEKNGLSVLDLVKHAAKTIIKTLDERDRLGIVTFASAASVCQELAPMSEKNKKEAETRVDEMRPKDMTNLWHGIREGLKMFEDNPREGNVPSLMVLTDGRPNWLCPAEGYVSRLQSESLVPTIQTFGFGHHLDSGLLKSIAEVGGGSFSFIPDAGMIGTVFVNAVANLQSTYANDAVLTLTYPNAVGLICAMGASNAQGPAERLSRGPHGSTQLKVKLGNLQYGQSRDVWLKFKEESLDVDMSGLELLGNVSYRRMTPAVHRVSRSCRLDQPSGLPAAELAYHRSRAKMCVFLASLAPISDRNEMKHTPVAGDKIAEHLPRFEELVATLPAAGLRDALNESLMEDLVGEEPHGQVQIAIGNQAYYTTWGQHYLLSLLGAHQKQLCNTFKDPGPLQYSTDSPLFRECRDRLNRAFDSLPAPKPSLETSHTGVIQMRSYNDPAGSCFAGRTPVTLASGLRKPIGRLRGGDRVRTPSGPREVAAVLRTRVADARMVKLGDVLVTPWHPIRMAGRGTSWMFPAHVPGGGGGLYTGDIYSVLLRHDDDPASHALLVGSRGIWGVTLGHGLTAASGSDDVRAHDFFGNHAVVSAALARLPRTKSGAVLGGGARRCERTGLVVGYRKPARGGDSKARRSRVPVRRAVRGGSIRLRKALAV